MDRYAAEQAEELSDESEEDEWQRWAAQHGQQQPGLAAAEATRE